MIGVYSNTNANITLSSVRNINLTAGSTAGGFIGNLQCGAAPSGYLATITNNYATGSVTSGSDQGGFIGVNQCEVDIQKNYAAATVALPGTGTTGGFIAFNDIGYVTTYADNYFDSDIYTDTNALGTNFAGQEDVNKIAPLTTFQMGDIPNTATNFDTWDFGATWTISGGYPIHQ